MKFLVIFLTFYLSLLANPLWFGNLQKTKTYSYLGYGVAESSSKAKREALNDISAQISIQVDTIVNDKVEDKNGVITTHTQFSSQQNSNTVFNDYNLLKLEFMDGKYFVAIEYENIPSLDKFIKITFISPL